MNITEVIQELINGKILVNSCGAELSFDLSYKYPFRLRIRNCNGVLCETTHPVRSFQGNWNIKQDTNNTIQQLSDRISKLEELWKSQL